MRITRLVMLGVVDLGVLVLLALLAHQYHVLGWLWLVTVVCGALLGLQIGRRGFSVGNGSQTLLFLAVFCPWAPMAEVYTGSVTGVVMVTWFAIVLTGASTIPSIKAAWQDTRPFTL